MSSSATDLDALRGLDAVLGRLVLAEAQRHARPPRGGQQLPHRGRRSRARGGGVNTLTTRALMPPPRERRLDVLEPARARALGQPHERLQVARRPRQPGGGEAQHGRAQRPPARRRRHATASRRSAGSRTTPPLPTRSRPTSNCGLTIARQSKRSAAQASTAGRTLRSEMNETSTTIRSGAYGSAERLERPRVDPLEHGHARVLAQPPVELAVGDVDGHDVRRPALEQAVGEAAGGGADVQAAPPGDGRRPARRARWRA